MSDDTPDANVDNVEPSMEDILASIRRIIADEDVAEVAEVGSVESGHTAPTAESYSIIEAKSQEETPANAAELSAKDDTALEPVTEAFDDDVLPDMDLLMADLEDDVVMSDLDMSELDVPDSSDFSSKLTGLGAAAAASLGALASAGTATAETLTSSRKNPKPEPMAARGPAIEDTASDNSLELLLDDDDMLSEPEAALNDILQIPDSDDTDSAEDDVEALLSDLLGETVHDDGPEDDRVIDPAADMIDDYEMASEEGLSDELLADLLGEETLDEAELLEDSFEAPDMPAQTQSSNDLDLVKSLMADLTADPYDASQDAAADNVSETDVMDDILALSIEDETSLQSEQTAPVESVVQTIDTDDEVSESDAFIIGMSDDLTADAAPASEPESLSLADIAKSAEADAEKIESQSRFAMTGFAAGAGIMVATSKAAQANDSEADALEATAEVDVNQPAEDAAEITAEHDAVVEADAAVEAETVLGPGESLDINTEPTTAEDIPSTPIPTQETAEMPKAAAKKETIIDEVTEEAAAGAFASLNQVVEEKAIMADRGDRIGDLVQEALRPMLKEWLDKNLKGIVERAVTKEVKRISTGK